MTTTATGPFDVVVAGAGPVGLTLAGALAGSRLSVLRLDPRAARPVADRPIALSHGSHLLLARLGAWDGLAATPITTIHVSQHRGFGRTVIRAADYGIPALGYVVPYSQLVPALAGCASTAVAPFAPFAAGACSADGESLALQLESGDGPSASQPEIKTRLLVFADGNPEGQAATGPARDYGQSAIVATVTSTVTRRGYAWERFTPQGPLALLPCSAQAGEDAPDGRHYALVWSVAAQRAPELLEMTDAQFSRALTDAFGARLGDLRVASLRSAFPLALRVGGDARNERTVMIGNASQTLHPVAGQGLNLGLRDAWELAELLRATPPEKIGDADFVRRYAAHRRLDRMGGIRFTDALVNIFSNSSSAFGALRGAGLAMLDLLPPARHFLARRMMFGSRSMP